MMLNATQEQALYLSQQLKSKQVPIGGMLFFDAMIHYGVGDTPKGIQGLDILFAKIRQKGLSIEKIKTHPEHKNFLLTVAVLIGNGIGNRLGEVPSWFAYDDFTGFSDNASTDRTFAFSLVAEFSYGISLPFGAIKEALSHDFSLTTYIEETANHILSKSQVNLLEPASDVCNLFLKKVRTGKILDNTMAYTHLLERVNFDYSYQSLQKIDKVLDYIKTTERLGPKKRFGASSYDRFVNDAKRQRFIYLLGCYIGAVSAQLAKTTVRWLNHEQMVALLDDPDIPLCLENNTVMMLENGRLRLPLLAVTNYLFHLDPDSSMGAADFADTVLQDGIYTLDSFSPSTTGTYPIPESWHTAASLAGMLMAFNILHVSTGSDTPPRSIDYRDGTKPITFVSHMDTAVSDLIEQLDGPTLSDAYGFLSYDTYVNLPTGRTDGITVDIRVYGEPSLTLQFIVPYRHARHPFGFAIYPLVYKKVMTPLAQDGLDALVHAFYQSAKAFKDPSTGMDFWQRYYIDKHDVFAPPAWMSKTVSRFDPEHSKIEILPAA